MLTVGSQEIGLSLHWMDASPNLERNRAVAGPGLLSAHLKLSDILVTVLI